MRKSKVCVTGVSGEDGDGGTEAVFEEIMAKSFPHTCEPHQPRESRSFANSKHNKDRA